MFLCPDAPEKCAVSSQGFQWFDLMDQTKEQILSKSLIAENILTKYIENICKEFDLLFDKISLCGFSQGCMISLQTGIKSKQKLNSILGYSGKIIDKDHLEKNINSKPNVLLMHGDKDEIVPVSSLLEAKEFFNKIDYKIQTKIFKNCEHRIPQEGSSMGLEFLKTNLY